MRSIEVAPLFGCEVLGRERESPILLDGHPHNFTRETMNSQTPAQLGVELKI